MTVFIISTYNVSPEKRAEHTAWGKNLVASMKNQPDQFKEVKSLRVCHQKTGDKTKYIALWEFKNTADSKKWEKRFHKKQIAKSPEFMALIVPDSFATHLWKPIKIMHRKNKPAKPSKTP
jgi:antibiotic biosynthesis monooxygenase (ABM) superfamily enzyme